jgi:hypothetical protein
VSVAAKPYAERDGSEITTYDTFAVEYRDSSHRYWIHRENERTAAISVTSALKVLDKPALVPWAERCGVEGALELERAGQLNGVSIKDATGAMRSYGLGAEAKRDTGADRGTAIHEALRLYCSEGTIPNVGDFPEEVRGYVAALCKWLVKASPEPVLTEQVVGSPTHGYAGRLDLLAIVDGRRTLCDLKTNPGGRVYPEAHLQTAAYMLALEECGVEPAERAIIIAAGEGGAFQASECCSEPSHFLAVLACHRAVRDVQAAVRAQEKTAA